MTLLRDLTIKKFHEGLTLKKFTALEITQAFFKYIKDADQKIGAYLSLNEETAIRDAEKVDLKIAKDEPIGELAGVPLAVKDNILIKGLPATAGSRVLENYEASYDASIIKKLKSEQAIFLGKTNLDEFAMGSSTENSGFRLTRNPHDPERVPGGSSGGSAAAVAGHMALAALGSDTGGSVRQPAALCGVVGLKPTYGAVSRSGLIALASSLDQIGPLTKTVEDAAILFRAIAGVDHWDSTSAPSPYGGEINEPDFQEVKSLTVGLPKEYFGYALDKNVSNALQNVIADFKSLKIKFKEISLPHTKYAIACYYIILPAEASTNLARYVGIRYSRNSKVKSPAKLEEIYFKTRALFGGEVKRRIILGAFVLSSGYYDAYYDKAQRARTLIAEDFKKAFSEVDVILTPTVPTPAFKIGEKTADPLAMYLSDIFTIPANLAGLPAISIPVKKQSGLPIGFQLIGRHFREADLFSLGQFYEKIRS